MAGVRIPLGAPTDPSEMEAKLGSVKAITMVALSIAIIIFILQMILAILVCKLWRSSRPSHRSDDAERGLELQNTTTSRGMATGDTGRHSRSRNTPRAAAPAPSPAPVGPSSSEALGRPVAAYNSNPQRYGENEDYYNPTPISRQPTYTVGSGLGQQTHGADYSTERRSRRFEDQHNTNVNNADYGRKGNKFAHGT